MNDIMVTAIFDDIPEGQDDPAIIFYVPDDYPEYPSDEEYEIKKHLLKRLSIVSLRIRVKLIELNLINTGVNYSCYFIIDDEKYQWIPAGQIRLMNNDESLC